MRSKSASPTCSDASVMLAFPNQMKHWARDRSASWGSNPSYGAGTKIFSASPVKEGIFPVRTVTACLGLAGVGEVGTVGAALDVEGCSVCGVGRGTADVDAVAGSGTAGEETAIDSSDSPESDSIWKRRSCSSAGVMNRLDPE